MKDSWNSTFWDEEWDEEFKAKDNRELRQAECDSFETPYTGYGYVGSKNDIPFEQTEEERAYGKKRKYSRGYYRKSTYIVLPRETTAK